MSDALTDYDDVVGSLLQVLKVVQNEDAAEVPAHPTESFGKVALLEGRGAPPPEDSNGLGGHKGNGAYYDFLQAYRALTVEEQRRKCRDIQVSAVNYARPVPLHASRSTGVAPHGPHPHGAHGGGRRSLLY